MVVKKQKKCYTDYMKTFDYTQFEFARDFGDKPMLSHFATKDLNTSKHFHRQLELFYVTEGCATVYINDEEYTLSKNEFCIADSFDVHGYVTQKYSEGIMLIISYADMQEFNDLKKDFVFAKNYVNDETIAKKCKIFLDTLRPFWLVRNESNPITSKICQALLFYLVESIGLVKKEKNKDKNLSPKIFDYLSKNLYSPTLTLESVAEEFGYNKYYFSKRFLATFKIPFQYYLNIVRAKDALYLIQVKHYTVLDAALYVGFNSQATFYRVVKQHFGGTPTTILL